MNYLKTALSAAQKSFDTLNIVELSRSNLDKNLSVIRELSGDRVIIPVLKANAYGHGLPEFASMLESSEYDFPRVAVDAYFEALELRKDTNLDILVMGPIDPVNFKNLKTERIAYVTQNIETLKAWADSGKPVTVHLEFDTGMKRHGIDPSQVDEVTALLDGSSIVVEGVMTHLADADNPETDDFVFKQYEEFTAIVSKLAEAGINPKLTHVQQSGGVTRDNLDISNAVRPGIALYGISPLRADDPHASDYDNLEPVLKLKTKISCIQHLEPGETTSYSRTYKASGKETIGIIPVGYFEVLPRSLSNKAKLTNTNGDELPIRGRICMNHCMVDVTTSGNKFMDEITVISSDKKAANSLQSLCDLSGEFNYEFMVNISQTVRRRIVD